MRRMTRSLLRVGGGIMGIVFLAGSVLPAAASHGGIHPQFRQEGNFFHCAGPTKVQNMNLMVSDELPSWDTSAPADSLQQGGGCVAMEMPWFNATCSGQTTPGEGAACFSGFFDGNIRDMTIDLYSILSRQARMEPPLTMVVRLEIDGEEIVNGRATFFEPEPAMDGLGERFNFSVADLGCAREVRNSSGQLIDVITDGFATEDGVGSERHEIFIEVDVSTLSSLQSGSMAWAWDASEVPSGVTFNPASLADAPLWNYPRPKDPADCG